MNASGRFCSVLELAHIGRKQCILPKHVVCNHCTVPCRPRARPQIEIAQTSLGSICSDFEASLPTTDACCMKVGLTDKLWTRLGECPLMAYGGAVLDWLNHIFAVHWSLWLWRFAILVLFFFCVQCIPCRAGGHWGLWVK